MVIYLSIVCLLQFGVIGFTIYHALRWAKVIFLLEDDLGEAIDIHTRTVEALEGIAKTKMYFDSPELKMSVSEALENVKVCQTATQNLIHSFTQRSKQRYIRLVDSTTEEDEVS